MSRRLTVEFFRGMFEAPEGHSNVHELMFPWIHEANERRRAKEFEWRRVQLERRVGDEDR
jgi:hypothetical protein